MIPTLEYCKRAVLKPTETETPTVLLVQPGPDLIRGHGLNRLAHHSHVARQRGDGHVLLVQVRQALRLVLVQSLALDAPVVCFDSKSCDHGMV